MKESTHMKLERKSGWDREINGMEWMRSGLGPSIYMYITWKWFLKTFQVEEVVCLKFSLVFKTYLTLKANLDAGE